MKPVTEVNMPTEPFNPPTGKRILVMPCGSAAPGCTTEAEETKSTAESLGWTVDMVDGKLDPTVWNQAVKQAAESGVDGIISISADPNLYADAMQVVAAKNIPFVIVGQAPRPSDVRGIGTYLATDPQKSGVDVAEWFIADSQGKANVLLLDFPGYPDLNKRGEVITDTLKSDCPDCTVVKVEAAPTTMGTDLAPLITNQLQKNPNINYIWGFEDITASFIQQGIRQAGKSDTVKLASSSGYPDRLSQLKTGEMSAELATPISFESWLAVDSLGRLMAGVPAERSWHLPQRILTNGNIDETSPEVLKEGWNTEIDYKTMFKKLWGMTK